MDELLQKKTEHVYSIYLQDNGAVYFYISVLYARWARPQSLVRADEPVCGRVFLKVAEMLKFVLLVNKQGQTRLSQYYEYVPVEERVTTEADIVRKCLARKEEQVKSKLEL